MSAVVNRVLSGGQRATRKTINAFVGKNNFALQAGVQTSYFLIFEEIWVGWEKFELKVEILTPSKELRPPNPAEAVEGVTKIVTFPYRALGGELSK